MMRDYEARRTSRTLGVTRISIYVKHIIGIDAIVTRIV